MKSRKLVAECFNFLYLPEKRSRKEHRYVGFVNFLSPEGTQLFHDHFHGRMWSRHRGVACIFAARLQGYKANLENWNSQRRGGKALGSPWLSPQQEVAKKGVIVARFSA